MYYYGMYGMNPMFNPAYMNPYSGYGQMPTNKPPIPGSGIPPPMGMPMPMGHMNPLGSMGSMVPPSLNYQKGQRFEDLYGRGK